VFYNWSWALLLSVCHQVVEHHTDMQKANVQTPSPGSTSHPTFEGGLLLKVPVGTTGEGYKEATNGRIRLMVRMGPQIVP